MVANNIKLVDIPLILIGCALFIVMLLCSSHLCSFIIILQEKYFLQNSVYIASLSSFYFTFCFAILSLWIIIDLVLMLIDINNFYPKTIKYVKGLFLKISLLIVLCVLVFFNYCRINDTGIYYNKLLGFSEKYISWSEVEEINIYPKVVPVGKQSYMVAIRFDIVTNKRTIDIWQDESISKHNYNEIENLLDFIKKNTDSKINVVDIFDERMIQVLGKQKNGYEMVNVFRHLRSAVHGRT
jgi:hypothetical protein